MDLYGPIFSHYNSSLISVLQNIRHVLINDAVVRGEQPALYWSRGEGAQFWAAWAEEEAIENRDRLREKPQ